MTHSSPLSTKSNPETIRDLCQSSEMRQRACRVPVFFTRQGGSRRWKQRWNLESEYVLERKKKDVLPWSSMQQWSVEATSWKTVTSKGPRLLCWPNSWAHLLHSSKIGFLTSRHLMAFLVSCFFTSEEVALGITLSRGVGAHFQHKSGICILRLEDTAWIFRNTLLQKSSWVKSKQKVSLFSFLYQMCSTYKWDADQFILVKGIPYAS